MPIYNPVSSAPGFSVSSPTLIPFLTIKWKTANVDADLFSSLHLLFHHAHAWGANLYLPTFSVFSLNQELNGHEPYLQETVTILQVYFT